ncbi:hypothetical protein PISMIDRAFT_689335 [Pisolithus microcarpus 441]|uniref:Uncharacterized protein n=1 Tax=Pisolithus microcarpus 441 TaxID=765257 RepID=A0A0C9Y6N9_9AGAM|nr:hypothetical protein PISMIDRAFT_689335 [Pisolithus microcarpus 441]
MVLGSTCVYYVVPLELVRWSIHAGGAFDYVASHSCLWVLVVVPLVCEVGPSLVPISAWEETCSVRPDLLSFSQWCVRDTSCRSLLIAE